MAGKRTIEHYESMWTQAPSEALRVGPGFDLSAFDRAGSPGWGASPKRARRAMRAYGKEVSRLQERLFAGGRSGHQRSVLLVLQGLDTSGKGGIVRHVVGMVDPQGVRIASFGVPSKLESSHHHLWRIEREVPPNGYIGVFDRSHYEQVLVVAVDELEPPEVNKTRYAELVDFDRRQATAGSEVLKVALLVSYDEQQRRLTRRLHRADKHWKYNPKDVDVRSKWDAYQESYQEMFDRTSPDDVPWYAIPADNRWYSRLAVTHLLYERLTAMAPPWPEATYDVDVELQRLAATSRD